jgi:hypothetical protein
VSISRIFLLKPNKTILVERGSGNIFRVFIFDFESSHRWHQEFAPQLSCACDQARAETVAKPLRPQHPVLRLPQLLPLLLVPLRVSRWRSPL